MRIIDTEMGRNADVHMISVYNILVEAGNEKANHIIAWLPCIDTIYISRDCGNSRGLGYGIGIDFVNGEWIYFDDVGVEAELSKLAD